MSYLSKTTLLMTSAVCRLERWCPLECCCSAAAATITHWLAVQSYDKSLRMVACCW